MSRAFVKESDGGELLDPPARRHSDHPNYITVGGEQLLRDRISDLTVARTKLDRNERLESIAERKRIDADLEYYAERLRRAIPVRSPPEPWTHVRIGAEVELLDSDRRTYLFRLVGEDEVDVNSGYISWTSPLGQVLLGGKVNHTVSWPRSDGAHEVEIVSITYPGQVQRAVSSRSVAVNSVDVYTTVESQRS